MAYNKFNFLVIVRIILILGLMILLSSIFLRKDLIFTQLIIGIILIVVVTDLIRFVNRTNYELSRFLSAIKNQDYSANFTTLKNASSFRQLNESFKGLIDTFRDHEIEKAAQYQFLNKLINQIDFGIIVFTREHKIELTNKKALELLEIPKVSDWTKIRNENTAFLTQIIELEHLKNQLIETRISGQNRMFSVSSSQIILQTDAFQIITFKDIRSEIEQKEIETWHRMIRILTHEIMNSVTPLVSLTETLEMLVMEGENTKKSSEISDEEMIDMSEAVQTIKTRSQGILGFVKDYRKLTKVQKPDFVTTDINELLGRCIKLFEADLTEKNIEVKKEPTSIQIRIDPHLIEQVMINLIKNAVEAIGKNGIITLSSHSMEDFFILSISDNGLGISTEKIDRIFIPFYTTKKEGSGIGLPLCRQILNLHKGHIEVSSDPGNTTFSLYFPLNQSLV